MRPDAGRALGPSITWYDVLGVVPTAAEEEIQRGYDAKARLLRPELVAGEPSKVVMAATRAQGLLDTARQVLGDPVDRRRYDEAVGVRRNGVGLVRPADFPSEPGSDYGLLGGRREAVLLAGLMAVTEWLAPHPRRPTRIMVPDVRGLFHSVCLEIAGRLEFRVRVVRLTEHPMPVDGLIVDQSPRAPAKRRRTSELTVQVWHPPVR
jgi:hypothetical protein